MVILRENMRHGRELYSTKVFVNFRARLYVQTTNNLSNTAEMWIRPFNQTDSRRYIKFSFVQALFNDT